MANSNLARAKKAKNDEFYTQYRNIESEVQAYVDYNPDLFRDKTVLLPCDDPEWSEFTRYFAQRFADFGIKKLISTSYAPDSKRLITPFQPTLFEQEAPQYDVKKSAVCGKIFTLTEDITNDGRVDLADLQWDYLEGDGDFRSEEVCRLRDEADIIVTNPPFSMFREFVDWIFAGGKQFLIIGNMNAITYKEVFPRIASNQMWLGFGNFNTGMYFRVPENFVYADTYKFDRERDGAKVNRVPGVCWYSNIEHGRRHQPLELMTLQENLRYSRHKEIRGKTPEEAYPRYDNYDAIEVAFTDAIPRDYPGAMGVPISFLDKYCPEQFEIVGSFNASSINTKAEDGYVLSTDTPTIIGGVEKLWNGPVVNKQPLYKRIVIRPRKS